MIDTVAEILVVAAARVWLFVQNPTVSPWLDFLHNVVPALGALWVLRVIVLVVHGHVLGRSGESEAEECGRVRALVERAGRRMLPCIPCSERGALARFLRRPRLRVFATDQVHLCVVGFFRPAILVSRGAIRSLREAEVEAALVHELTHVIRLDNLRRVLSEAFVVLVPVVIWALASTQLVGGSARTLVGFFLGGLAAGIVLRFVILSAVSYGQERRADERAATVLGDRLVVASALVKVGRAAGPQALSCQPVVAGSHFGMFRVPIAARVKRLISGERRQRRLARIARPLAMSLALGVLVVLLLGAGRASSIYAESGGREGLLEMAGLAAAPVEAARESHSERDLIERIVRLAVVDLGGDVEVDEHICHESCDTACDDACDWGDAQNCLMQCRVVVAEINDE